MPRNMSFALTTQQIRRQTKTVTRRKGWEFLKPGDVVNACVKCRGLKPGEKVERLCQIRVLDVRRERLSELLRSPGYGMSECVREGFPNLSAAKFVEMFTRHMGGLSTQTVTRIEFEYPQD
jgi:hypothetical protein